ncbi:hypothetical protein Tdes44962_MAKER01391 [Teratosphaeria destructans]|uniref:Uncharacterized protein n=1 Tax=Teratosphaeria destructans TaxID=418781 RepID=A0A9W7T040_9PEZI|nr:hypothetical protein Tdes44962_MAKER01391 [Teratosphaeria destructans]
MRLSVAILCLALTASSVARDSRLPGSGEHTQVQTSHNYVREAEAAGGQHQAAHTAVNGPPSYAQRHTARHILTKPKNVIANNLPGVEAYESATDPTHLIRRQEDYRGSSQEHQEDWLVTGNHARSLKDTLHEDFDKATSAVTSALPNVSQAVDQGTDEAHNISSRGDPDPNDAQKSSAERAHGSRAHKFFPRDADLQSQGQGHDFYKPGGRTEFHEAQKLRRRDAMPGVVGAGTPTRKFVPRDVSFRSTGQAHDFYKSGGRAEFHRAQNLKRRDAAPTAGAGSRVVVGNGPPPVGGENGRRGVESKTPPVEHEEGRPRGERGEQV